MIYKERGTEKRSVCQVNGTGVKVVIAASIALKPEEQSDHTISHIRPSATSDRTLSLARPSTTPLNHGQAPLPSPGRNKTNAQNTRPRFLVET